MASALEKGERAFKDDDKLSDDGAGRTQDILEDSPVDQLPDPDAGLSEEERAAQVRTHFASAVLHV